MSMKKETINFMLRLPPELHEALNNVAKKEMRSLHSQIILFLNHALNTTIVHNYRDQLTNINGEEIGSVVGCGLDRVKRQVTEREINNAIEFYVKYKAKMRDFPIGARRQAIQEFIENNGVVPDYIK